MLHRTTLSISDKPRQLCFSSVCPDGGRDGVCAEPTHWVNKDDLWEVGRQHYGGSGQASTRVPMTTAHLMQTVAYNIGHAITHNKAALDASDKNDRQFNLEHTDHHLEEAQDHLLRLMEHIREHYPKEAAELDTVEQAEGVQPMPEHDGGG